MEFKVNATRYLDAMYYQIEPRLRQTLEDLLMSAAERGEFEVVIDQSQEFFDQLRAVNFFEMPLGFKLQVCNENPQTVTTRLSWQTFNVHNASIVNELVAVSINNFSRTLDEKAAKQLMLINHQLEQNDFLKVTQVAFYDATAQFIKKHQDYFMANGFKIRVGLVDDKARPGRAIATENVVFLTLY